LQEDDMKFATLHIRLSEMLVVLAMITLVTAVFLQVTMRYLFNYSLPWAVELSRLSLVWLVFCGMALCLSRDQHPVVGILRDRYSGASGRLIFLGLDVLVFGLFAVMLFGGAQMAILTWPQMTSSLGISRGVLYAAVPVGAALILIELIRLNLLRFAPRARRADAQGDGQAD
jgi:TRAP-type C4-dicarboxylate transport system permease small subunit